MLVLGETYNERINFIKECLLTSKAMSKAIRSSSLATDPLALQVLEQEAEYRQRLLQEITELARWLKQEGIGKDEPYTYPSQRKGTVTNG